VGEVESGGFHNAKSEPVAQVEHVKAGVPSSAPFEVPTAQAVHDDTNFLQSSSGSIARSGETVCTIRAPTHGIESGGEGIIRGFSQCKIRSISTSKT
jgi:hypothetical protein